MRRMRMGGEGRECGRVRLSGGVYVEWEKGMFECGRGGREEKKRGIRDGRLC
jgi:hypothetical protein